MTDIIKALEKIVAATDKAPSMGERELGVSIGRIREIAEDALASYRASVDGVELPEADDVTYDEHWNVIDCYYETTVRRLIAEAVERERKDAERYRWLRGSDAFGFGHPRWARWQVQVWEGNPPHWENVAGDALDAAIDAAMGGKE